MAILKGEIRSSLYQSVVRAGGNGALALALANVFHDCDVREQSSGIWTDALDSALRSAAAEALSSTPV